VNAWIIAQWGMRFLIVLLVALPGLGTAGRPRNVTFYHISDQHYGAKAFDPAVLRRTIDAMNSLPGTPYPASIGGTVGVPRGVIMTGDLTDSGLPVQWSDFVADWGFTGKEGRLGFPVYEMAGNHDGAPSTRPGDSGYVRRQIILRNRDRIGIVHKSANGLHYSWDWDDVHFVCLNEYTGPENDQRYPGNPAFNRKKEDYGNPAEQSLQFLAEDLASQVGTGGRPVILAQHYGFDDFAFHPWGEKASWWTEEHALRLWETLEGYNVMAILSGHDGSEAAVEWHGILNQHMDDPARFGVYHITDRRMTIAKRNSATGAWEETGRRSTRASSSLPPELLQGPYLIYSGDPAKMTVAWRCKSNVACNILWGDDQFHYEDGNVKVLPYDRSNHLYRYTFSGLPADTGVKFTIEINGRYAPGMFYTPPAADSTRVKFMAYSFTPANPAGMDRLYKAMYERIYEDPAYHTFLLQTGDFVAGDARLQDWDRQFFSRDPQSRHARYVQSRLPVMGTVRSPAALAGKILPYPFKEDGYYAFDYGPVHVVMLDAGRNCAPDSPQYRWLKTDLESTRSAWKLILTGGQAREGTPIQQLIQPLCEAYGVDVCFAGQKAAYARTEVHGTRYIAAGGQSVQNSSANKASSPGDLHYCTITVDGDALTFQALRHDGTRIDSFSMRDIRGLEELPAAPGARSVNSSNPQGRGQAFPAPRR
jgi:hypothetical protein